MVSVTGDMLTAFRGSFEHIFLDDLCRHSSASADWAEGESFPCHIEEGVAADGAPLDYEGGNGYGYTLHVPADQNLATTDRIEWRHATNTVGILEITRVAPVGTLAAVRIAEAVMR